MIQTQSSARPLGLIAFAAVLLAAGAALAQAPFGGAPSSLSETEMVRFLVQSRCADAAGRPNGATPIDAACVNRSAQRAGDPAAYRKHDWPADADRAAQPGGYQVSDAVLSQAPQAAGAPVIITHTFDFGGVGGGFGSLNLEGGDGGQVIAVAEGAAAVFMTQDGGIPRPQWFIGPGCKNGRAPQELAWLLFTEDTRSSDWTWEIARLNGAASQAECPASFGSAYTRYVRQTFPLPFLQSGVPAGDHSFDTIVSEHYDLPTIQASTHLERFYLAKDLGMVRWERWQHLTGLDLPAEQAAAYMAGSGRCPPVHLSTPPGDGWAMVDCRMWTNLETVTAPWSVQDFGWSGLDARPYR